MKVLGVSSGMGVSLFPFKKYVIGNIESRAIFHTPKDIAWTSNFGDIPLYRGIPEKKLRPDVIISSPDCGSGSILRLSRSKVLGDAKKNFSLLLYIKAMQLYKPKFSLFENLEALFKSFPLEDFKQALPDYDFIVHNAPVTMWGNSQIHRHRLIMILVRKDISTKNLRKFFKIPDYRSKNVACVDLYGDLDDQIDFKENVALAHIRENGSDKVTVYSKFKCSVDECTDYWFKRGFNKRRWEVDGRNFTTAPGVYRNRKQDYPATARKANRQFDHNGLMLTPRQLARIQGCPDDFRIFIDPGKLNYWINKGRALVTKTPPMEISKWFYRKLKKSKELWY